MENKRIKIFPVLQQVLPHAGLKEYLLEDQRPSLREEQLQQRGHLANVYDGVRDLSLH